MYNLYADVGAFERRILHGQTLGSADVQEALRMLGAASRSVDAEIRRTLYALTATRYFNGNGRAVLDMRADLISVTTLKVDEDDDGVHEVSLVEDTDYVLENPDAEDEYVPPFTRIRILTSREPVVSAFPRGRQTVELAGRFGYAEDTSAVLTSAGVAVTGTLTSASDTTLATSASASPEISAGMTLQIGTEDIFVLAGAASPFTVARGVNGTTAAAHSAAAISRYVFDDDAVEATMLQVGRLWKRKDVPILPVIAAPGIGEMQLPMSLDPDLQAMLSRLRRYRGF